MQAKESDKVRAYFAGLPGRETRIISEIKGNRCFITFNNPQKRNAFSFDMYDKFSRAIKDANNSQQVKFIIVSGAASTFSSGNDLSSFSDTEANQICTPFNMAYVAATVLKELCETIIKSAKPLFAVVETMAIGFAFTQLLLYDRVYAVQGTNFVAPLIRIAQGPEMCASYTFPRVFGKRNTEELLVKGQSVDTAFIEKYQVGISCRTREEADRQLSNHLDELDKLEWESYKAARLLMQETVSRSLLQANQRQIANLIQRWQNPNLLSYVTSHLKSKSARPKM